MADLNVIWRHVTCLKHFLHFYREKKVLRKKNLKVSLSRNVDEKIIKMFVFLKKWKVVLITASKKAENSWTKLRLDEMKIKMISTEIIDWHKRCSRLDDHRGGKSQMFSGLSWGPRFR